MFAEDVGVGLKRALQEFLRAIEQTQLEVGLSHRFEQLGTSVWLVAKLAVDPLGTHIEDLPRRDRVPARFARIAHLEETFQELRNLRQGERVEVLESVVPPLRPDRLLHDLPDISFLILVINSGFDISLRDWRRIARRAECPIRIDVHSLALTLELHTARRYRALPEWMEWAKGTTYLQAILKEVASMLGDPERTPGRDEIDRFVGQAFDLGVQAAFVTLGAEGVLVLQPGRTDKVRSPSAAEVVDTTGCGDIFCAGAAAMLAWGADPIEAAAFGNELASEARASPCKIPS